MNFGRIISELLIKNQKVSIPGFGKFTYFYVSAEVYKFTNRVAPPAHKLEFSNETEDDNSLIETYALEYDISSEAAKEKTEAWVAEINSILNNGGQYQLEMIGRFKKDAGKIIFNPDEKSILFADNFGLESVKIPLMEIDEPKQAASIPVITPTKVEVKNMDRTEKKKEHKELSPVFKKVAIALAVLVLLLIGAYFIYESGALKSIASFFKSEKSEQMPVALSDTADELKRNALNYSENNDSTPEDSSQRYIVYYIVAGSFKSMQNAEKELENLKKRGFNPDILNMNDTLFRVTIGTYKERRKAVEEYIALSNQDTGLNIWLFSQLNK